MQKYTEHFSTKKTSQRQKIPGSKQVKNSAGGFSFQVSDFDRLDRFLILGSDSPTFYASSKKLTVENAECIARLIKTDGIATVNRIVEVSQQGLAPKNDPAIFALAMCAKTGDPATRTAAYQAVDKVCRIGTHLFNFAEYCEGFGGWGRGMRNAVARWYNNKPVDKLQYQMIKYQQRDGWSHRDLLRLAHVNPSTNKHSQLFEWATSGSCDAVFEDESDDALWLVWAFETAKKTEKVSEIVKLINEYNLPREAIPTQFLKDPTVWDALLTKMPLTAMIRNLGNMSKCGLLTPMSKASGVVVDRLGDTELLQKARIHPLNVLVAMNTYGAGKGFRGSGTWKVVQPVVDALDGAFYKSFKYVEPANKRTLIALDVSGSMSWHEIAGMPGITPRVGAGAMSLVTAAIEPQYHITAFSHRMVEAKISPKMRLDSVLTTLDQIQMGGTDCALPMIYAQENKLEVDTFIVYTDSMTWAGEIHPVQALKNYRQKTGIPSKLVVVGMESSGFTIADPDDSGTLDVVGFNSAAPSVISNFSRD